jgi:hypothetical protein
MSEKHILFAFNVYIKYLCTVLYFLYRNTMAAAVIWLAVHNCLPNVSYIKTYLL